jgi:K+-transporting ATPase ATPase A chain
MTTMGVLQIAVFFGLILICAKPLGAFMARVFEGQRTFLHPVLRWLEVLTYKVAGIREDAEQRWTQYTAALLSFSVFGFLLTYLLQRAQGFLPFNPQHFGAAQVPPDLAFNTATSFVTNTNWQAYGGESTLSYLVQMAALAVQNFASAAAGLAIAVALIRGFSRQGRNTIGNFWVDVTRATVYILLPLSVVFGLLLVSQGVVQNFNAYTDVATIEGAKQTIAQGPVASQEAIKQLGTNGGGFFNANAAHPFENPTPFTNLISMWLIFLIPGALTYTFGKMVGDTRQGWAIFAAFSVMFLIGVASMSFPERALRRRPVAASGRPGPRNIIAGCRSDAGTGGIWKRPRCARRWWRRSGGRRSRPGGGRSRGLRIRRGSGRLRGRRGRGWRWGRGGGRGPCRCCRGRRGRGRSGG